MDKKEVRSGEKWITKIAIGIILIMASLITYLIVNYDEIHEGQYYRTLQYLNAK